MSSESDLHLPTIVPLLQGAKANPSKVDADPRHQSSSEASIMQHPHLVPSSLKVEMALLTKELAKFRACDQNTCFYCREWAQWVFKKTFGKDKNSGGTDKKGLRSNSSNGSDAGSGSEPKKKHKEYAMVVCERFYQRSTADTIASGGGHGHGRSNGVSGAGSVAAAAIAASKAGTGTGPAPAAGSGQEGFVAEIVDTVRDWIQQPSALYTSPEVFSLVDFEALYAAYPLQSQEQNQQQDDVTPILSTISIEKAQMTLGHQGYPLLKRVTKAQLQNQIMNPTCQHTKGHSKTPADLDLDKELFNEELQRMRMRDQEGLRKQIGPVWRHVEEALERMDGAEKVRSGILAPTRGKEFAHTYKEQLVSFQEIWAGVEAKVKKPSSKKKSSVSDSPQVDPVEEVDSGFKLFIDNMQHVHKQLTVDVLESSERSLREFIKELAAAQTKILKLALTRIQEGKVGTARIDKILEESPEKCRNALKMVEQLIPIFDTKMGQFRVLVLNKLKEVDEEVESVAATYSQESQKTVQGRLEKVANKDFRRRIKKLEFLSVETRKWFFQSRLTLFSSLDFATVCLNTLGILMEEAEVLEAVQLGLHDDHFRSRVLKSQEGRMKLAQQFREGVKTGRRVLAVMVSRLMMREGARAMGEMAAIQKEKKFLKSIGQDVSDSKFSTKGYLVPSRDVTPTASAQVSDDEDADLTGALTPSKNRKKKDKKKKKAAEAAAAAAAVASEEPEQVAPITEPSGGVAGSNRATIAPVIKNTAVEPLTAVSSKEARELKKQAKKDSKRQAKEAAEAEDNAAAQAAAKKAEEARHAREETQLAQEKKAAEDAREAEAARMRKAAVEEAEASRRTQEAARRAQEAREVEEAVARERTKEKERKAREQKELQQAKRLSSQVVKDAVPAATVTSAPTFAAIAAPVVETPVAPAPAPAATDAENAQSSASTAATAEAKVPTWGPSAATLANRAAQAAREAERIQQATSRKRFSEERSDKAFTNQANGSRGAQQKERSDIHQDILANLPKTVTPQDASPLQGLDTQPTLEADEEDAGTDNVEDLARLPNQTLVSLVHTLQVENKSLLTTLVSMQQQVSSLTERYSTLASLAREHEQQAIQSMEAQKQREMEEIQRYVWKVEERCRQLEKHVLASHQHRMQMQQMQQQQQQQQYQQHQQHSMTSGPPGISGMGNVSMPPPGFNSGLLGLGRQPSAPSSPLMSHRTLSGMDSPSQSSMSTSGITSAMASGGSMDSLMSPLTGSFNASLLSSAPSSGGGGGGNGGSAPPGFEAGPKKTHWRQRGEVRCGNCAQLGHASSECQAGCRYCDVPGHLSQDCPRIGQAHV
ncbi:hypothetical protein BGZ96_006081 [Linnemannia gamsii]|uniref:CCHC-type domain-containing protein n=1 Tax=Linnemannia gamsii TaxID=64522 RepID=A0ABQ7K3H6_9FUNG|nr:hypothetical protein BGZ96_006081 [Linnemannia gamsii]